MQSLASELAPSWLPTCCASGQTDRHIESAPGARRFTRLKLTFWSSDDTTATGRLLAKLVISTDTCGMGSQRCFDRRSLLVAGASSLASIMLPRVSGNENAFPDAVRAHRGLCRRRRPLQRSWCSHAPCSAWWWSTSPTRIRLSQAPRSQLTSRYAAGKQLTAMTDDEGTAIFGGRPLFRKATWTRQRP